MKITIFESKSFCGEDITLDSLQDLGELHFYGKPDPAEVARLIGDSDAVLCSKVLMTSEIMAQCPKLKYIGLTATGYNNVDTVAAKKRGITVTNVPSYSTDAVSQLVLAFILQFATSLIRYDASTRRGDWKRSELFCYFPYPIVELRGKKLGIVGLGEIGRRVAGLAEAFGMEILYTSRSPKDVPYRFVDRETLFRESDFITLHCPLNGETRGLVGEKTLRLMKRTAYLINTSRGPVVDEAALAKALSEGQIAGFAGDVLEEEPMREDCPLQGLDNCILTPHVAWAPYETRLRLKGEVEENLRAFLRGERRNDVTA